VNLSQILRTSSKCDILCKSESRQQGERKHYGRDNPSPHHLMALVYQNTRRRIDVAISPAGQNDFVADGTALSIVEWSERQELNFDAEQRTAFQIATASYILTYYSDAESNHLQPSSGSRSLMMDFRAERDKLRRVTRLASNQALRMYLDGPGGAGKSTVMTELLAYARDYTSRLNLTFDMRTIIVSAMSGVAAVSIGGETTHSVAYLNGKIPDDDETWANARLLIIDEISFMNTYELDKLDQKLRTLMKNHVEVYGGINVIFSGDFRQLEPCQGKPLYSTESTNHKKWMRSINCYIELKGMWRFKDDKTWGEILSRIRINKHTCRDIDAINACCLEERRRRHESIPDDVAYCVYRNRDRSAINNAMFSTALKTGNHGEAPAKDFLVVHASDMKRKFKSGKLVPLKGRDASYLYENCSDDRVVTKGGKKSATGKESGGHFVELLLKLHKNQPLMLVSNDDVPNGHANGTRTLVTGVVLKPNASMKKIMLDGHWCHSVEADDVQHIVCRSEDKREKEFKIKPKQLTCTVKVPVPSHFGAPTSASLKMTLQVRQFPVLTNYATTGHKLQGQTKERLIISVWSKRRNWNYVALSRVKTREGLYLVTKLPYDTDFSVPPDLSKMMTWLRSKSPENMNYDLEGERAARARRHR
jgi:PIF1-like helicase